MTHPADLMMTTPSTMTSNTCKSGLPFEAIQSAQSVGQSRRKIPIGRCSRIR